jgi:hypothetical protein
VKHYNPGTLSRCLSRDIHASQSFADRRATSFYGDFEFRGAPRVGCGTRRERGPSGFILLTVPARAQWAVVRSNNNTH